MLESGLQIVIAPNTDNATVQATVCMEEGSIQSNPLMLSSIKNVSMSTDDLYAMIPFCIEGIQDDDKALEVFLYGVYHWLIYQRQTS